MIEWIEYRVGRWLCSTFGHRWSEWYDDFRVCTRNWCRGHHDGQEWR